MPSIAFIDTEINPETGEILDLMAILDTGETFHKNSLPEFQAFIEKADFICGHNILNHDLKYIEIKDKFFIDTLFWSPLLFPEKVYHNLSRDEKLPVNNAIKTRDLFYEELIAFENLNLKEIFYFLLHNKAEFNGLFKFLKKEEDVEISEKLMIHKILLLEICKNAPLKELIKDYPVEFAYSLALINENNSKSTVSPWVLMNFPKIQAIIKKLRNSPCNDVCYYCSQKLDAKKTFAGDLLQEYAANAADEWGLIVVISPFRKKDSAHLLYITPESLHSNTIENLLLQRNVVRFVIEEAHCFSAWGQNFRMDYLYIADFIKKLQEKKNCENIPVSCFTANTKPEVIEDIQKYFKEKLDLNIELIRLKNSKKNSSYKILEIDSENKYKELLNIIENKNCQTIVYVSNTKTAKNLTERLRKNNYLEIVQIVVFGMEVDKKDVDLVVHYDISDSLENYMQEAIGTDCYILFDENDLDKHFIRLNQSKLDNKELGKFYENRTKQIHIIGEFAKKMLNSQADALNFANDYFNCSEDFFINKYFKNEKERLKRNISAKKDEQLFGDLSPAQRKIIDDKETACLVVKAGPGCGKTKTLVSKLASLLIMESVKSEQLLVLTFSKVAATEFKKQLIELVDETAHFVEIKTFHSNFGEIKTCLVIDEAQNMSAAEFEIVKTLKEKNEGIRIIVFGDYSLKWENGKEYELLENYRSKANIVQLANNFAKPMQAMQKENGEIKIIECKSENPIWSVICDIIDTPLSGSTCVFTFSNQEVWEIAEMLINKNKAVKIIQSNDGFPLFNILEIRYFYDNLDDNWEIAKQKLNKKFKNTNGLEIAKKVIRKFEQNNQQVKDKTDFKDFALESKLEDFWEEESTDMIFVSTMHKAKGKEFDNVFIMLNNFDTNTDEKKRLLYVAMTRAKNLLHIHFHGNNIFGITPIYNHLEYPRINKIPMLLTRKDVNLGFFSSKQKEIEKLNGNEILQQGVLLDFSKDFKEKIEKRKNEGYLLKEITVNFIVYWKGEYMKKEIKIILPKVIFLYYP